MDSQIKVAVFPRGRPPGEQRPLRVMDVDARVEDIRLRPRAVRDAVAAALRALGYPVPTDGYQVFVLAEEAHGAQAAVYLPAGEAVIAKHIRKRPVRRSGPHGGEVMSHRRRMR